jgi:hypothetical protein
MPISDESGAEQELRAAQKRLEHAGRALERKHEGGGWEDFASAWQEVLRCERALSALRGEPHAVPLDFPQQWDIGAPMPHLFTNDSRTLLTFYVRVTDPGWDGTYVTVKSPGGGAEEVLALVEFERCISAKLGAPNDEVHAGHPLFGKGLDPYTAQEILNFPWLTELESINRFHSQFDPSFWRTLHHYMFWFHDTTFECVARSFSVEVHRETMAQMLNRVTTRLLY